MTMRKTLTLVLFISCIYSLSLATENATTASSMIGGMKHRRLRDLTASDADAVVAQDGTGRFSKIVDAVAAAPDNSPRRYVIYVKRRLYKEYVSIGEKKVNIVMIGDGIGATIVSGDRNVKDGRFTTAETATFAVAGRGFIGRDMTFENTAGAVKEQAVAFLSTSEASVLYRCSFRGYQDTLCASYNRQFYRECVISGSVDFIFGNAKAVFQKCDISVRRGKPGQYYPITAQGRGEPAESTGFVLQSCNVSAEDSSLPVYLGRPWKEYSRVVVMESGLSGAIRPEGWSTWNASDFGTKNSYYAEYGNSGPGSGVAGRVKWPGYRGLINRATAEQFTVARFIGGDSWLPSTGVEYDPGL